jgi:hypothetical protein
MTANERAEKRILAILTVSNSKTVRRHDRKPMDNHLELNNQVPLSLDRNIFKISAIRADKQSEI